MSHSHVVTIHAVDETGKTPYLVIECIEGVTLQDKIERVGTLQLREILRIGGQTAAGLTAAHGQGLIHRDVKPQRERCSTFLVASGDNARRLAMAE